MSQKARLKTSFKLAEFTEYDKFDQIDFDDIVEFDEDSIVEVIKEVRQETGGRQFIIYDKKLNEATVVAECHLEFIPFEV